MFVMISKLDLVGLCVGGRVLSSLIESFPSFPSFPTFRTITIAAVAIIIDIIESKNPNLTVRLPMYSVALTH